VSDPKDRSLSELYQQAEDVTSPQHLDDKILAMAKLHAAENQTKPWFQVQSFGAIASACVVVIALSVVFIEPDTEQALNEKVINEQTRAMSPDLSSEKSSFAAPNPEVMATPVSSARLKAASARLNAAKKTLETTRKRELIMASPESYLDSIEQLITENKLADARLRFDKFETQYPKLAQFQNSAFAVQKLKYTNPAANPLGDELSVYSETSRLMGSAVDSDFVETLVEALVETPIKTSAETLAQASSQTPTEESEFSRSTSTELKKLDQAPENNRLQQRVNAIIQVLSTQAKNHNE